MGDEVNIRIGRVIYVEYPATANGSGALRVKARIDGDDNRMLDGDIPWAFPLLPKVFQSVPKVGESVFIFTSAINNVLSQRYYIGPIITQPQYHEMTPSSIARTMLDKGDYTPLEQYTDFQGTEGSFPSVEDVAVIGRGKEDIALKYDSGTTTSEVDIRCGIRGSADGTENPSKIGNIIFNQLDPAYIQLKYKNGIAKGASSIVNIVANKINIMSNLDEEIKHNLADSKEMVKESEMDNVMKKLHQVPLGDVLVEYLDLLKGAILHHVHPWPGMEQCGDYSNYITRLVGFGDLNKILSKHVRVS